MTEEGQELQVEATGETVGEAKWQALRQLQSVAPGLDRGGVRFQVISEGERGLLGVGYSPARVVATAPSPPARRIGSADSDPVTAPGSQTPAGALVHELVERITEALGIECRLTITEEGAAVVATCSGPELGLLIGRHGQTIDAVQYLANTIVRRAHPDQPIEVAVDAAGYRARRETALHSLAVASAERALERGSAVELEPMSAVERKAVHVRLKDYRGVETSSEGMEPNRYVVISPAPDGG